MIPEDVKKFITNQLPLAMVIGTRNADLKPNLVRAFAAKVSEDGTHLTVYTSKYFITECADNLENNGKIAFTAGHPASHVSYQLKGEYVNTLDCTEADYAGMNPNVVAFGDMLEQYYGPAMAEKLRNFPLNPSVGITFKVEDVFNQTPGPGAGNKIN